MPNMTTIDKSSYSELLASNVLDASKGALFGAAGLKPDDTNRTILIGVGGTGVRTIDYVKGAISKRLAPGWEKYVAFLGVDASWTEFDQARYLVPSETILTTQTNVANRMSQAATYPAATRPFMPEGAMLGALSSDGSGRTRLVGKVKIHDQAPGDLGVDQKIVQALSTIKTNMLALAPGGGTYQVYVIGSVCGGTCSGSFLELPALIRKAIPNQVKVHAMLYLPDTLATLDPANASQLYANGYASLKELNYYMGMFMRPDYSESWSYNDPAARTLTHRSSTIVEEFIDIPYLIGTTNGTAKDAAQEAMETIAEFLISLLAQINSANGGVFLTSAFLSNATSPARSGDKDYNPGNNQQELQGQHHEFPKRFAAIGFAEASAPHKLVRAYTVGKICENSGIKPVDAQKRATLAAAGAQALIPFRGETDLLNATEGTAKAKQILQPLAQILGVIHSGDFNFGRDLQQQDVTWTNIKNGHFDSPAISSLSNNVIAARTAVTMMDQLRNSISNAYLQYRKNVQDYVREEGPYAFVNLYHGNFLPVNNDFGMGIGKMIQNLVDGNQMSGDPYYGFKTVNQAQSDLNAARNAIVNTAPGFLGIEGGKHKDQASQWVSAYNNWGKARIDEKRREVALGNVGSLHNSFQIPAAKLTDEVKAFGGILESLASIYQHHGNKMETYTDFQNAQDTRTEVNLAAVNPASYAWLKSQADAMVANTNARKLRDDLVDHFFAADQNGIPNTELWLDVPETRITTGTKGEKKLAIADVAVPAREIFDKYLAENFPMTLNASIEEMFIQLQNAGQPFATTARNILKQLAIRSQPHVNADIPANAVFSYVIYPEALNNNPPVGPQIAAAINTEAQNMFPGIGVYSSADADSIMFYQMAAPFEIYRLHELTNWERNYVDGNFGITNSSSYLHGMSPDVVEVSALGQSTAYVENMPWQDYPSIVRYDDDPRKPDAVTGQISREGQLRLKLDALIKEAKELGVLYSVQDGHGQWIINRVHCDKTITWNFNIGMCTPGANGMLPLGKVLADTIATQNNKTLAQISREVKLYQGGVFEKHVATEKMAWEYAARVLRAHVPMYIEVRETVKKFAVWADQIRMFNEAILSKQKPGMMIDMLKGRVLKTDSTGAWVLELSSGTRMVANLSPIMMQFLPAGDSNLINNGMLGYYLFGKLETILNTFAAFKAAHQEATQNLNKLIGMMDVVELTAGKALADQILNEKQLLAAKGAHLDGKGTAPRTAFVQEMNKIGITDPAEMTAIDVFYGRL